MLTFRQTLILGIIALALVPAARAQTYLPYAPYGGTMEPAPESRRAVSPANRFDRHEWRHRWHDRHGHRTPDWQSPALERVPGWRRAGRPIDVAPAIPATHAPAPGVPHATRASILPTPNPEVQVVAKCAASSSGEPLSTAGCAAAALTTMEIKKCANGIGTNDGCFGPGNTLRKLAENGLKDLRDGPGDNNELVKILGKKTATTALKSIGKLFGF